MLANRKLETEQQPVKKGRQGSRQAAAGGRQPASHVGRGNSPVRRRAFGTGTASWYIPNTNDAYNRCVGA